MTCFDVIGELQTPINPKKQKETELKENAKEKYLIEKQNFIPYNNLISAIDQISHPPDHKHPQHTHNLRRQL